MEEIEMKTLGFILFLLFLLIGVIWIISKLRAHDKVYRGPGPAGQPSDTLPVFQPYYGQGYAQPQDPDAQPDPLLKNLQATADQNLRWADAFGSSCASDKWNARIYRDAPESDDPDR